MRDYRTAHRLMIERSFWLGQIERMTDDEYHEWRRAMERGDRDTLGELKRILEELDDDF